MMLNRLGAEVYFAGPEKWYDPTLEQYGTFGDFDELLPQMDVVNLLRVQNERLTTADGQAFDANQYHQAYGLTLERAAKDEAGVQSLCIRHLLTGVLKSIAPLLKRLIPAFSNK